MNIALIHGQSHKGSTYHVARILAEKLEGEIVEFFLPRDFGKPRVCISCHRIYEGVVGSLRIPVGGAQT